MKGKPVRHNSVELRTGRVFSVESKWCGTSVKMGWSGVCRVELGVGSSVEMKSRVNGGGFGNRLGTSVEFWTRWTGSGGEF